MIEIEHADEIKACLLALRAMEKLYNKKLSENQIIDMALSFEEDLCRLRNKNEKIIYSMIDDYHLSDKFFGSEILMGTNDGDPNHCPFKPFSKFLNFSEFDFEKISLIRELFDKLVRAGIINFLLVDNDFIKKIECGSSSTPTFDNVKYIGGGPKHFVYKTFSDAKMSYTEIINTHAKIVSKYTPTSDKLFKVNFESSPTWICSGSVSFKEDGIHEYDGGLSASGGSGISNMSFYTTSLYTIPISLPDYKELYSPNETKSLTLAREQGSIKYI